MAPKNGFFKSATILSVTLAALSLGIATPATAAGTADQSSSRISGADRYSTAAAISRAGFGPGVPVVYVATGSNYPDALSAAPAAAKLGGPLLLVQQRTIPTAIRNELIRLKPAKIVVVGGTGAVSTTVYNQLKILTPKITRQGGSDRYETSRIVITRAFSESDSAYLATGSNFPDALSASAAASTIAAPVILVKGSKTSVDSPTRQMMSALGVSDVIIAGGAGVVSNGIVSSLRTAGLTVTRLSGADRYETSGAVNRDAFTSSETVYLATGLVYADALAGAALAGKNRAPLYVVPTNCIPAYVEADMDALGTTKVVLLGGTGALNYNVQNLGECGSKIGVVTFRGYGDNVIRVNKPDGTNVGAILDVAYSGEDNFAIVSRTARMDYGDLDVNEIGAYKGTVLIEDSATVLEITASGPWTIRMRSIRSARVSSSYTTSGATDDVVKIRKPRGNSSASTLAVSYTGESNFVIISRDSGMNYGDLLVNEIGSYSGRVLMPASDTILEVTASGNWTVTAR